MSNGYNDYRLEMEYYVKHFERDGKTYTGVCYKSDYEVDAMGYEFCDFMCEDIVIHKQVNFINPVPLAIIDGERNTLQTNEQLMDNMKVLIVQVGTSNRNPDGTYDEDYEKTLYVFHNDWLMSDGKDLFVVDEHHINEWKEITEQEFVKINKGEK